MLQKGLMMQLCMFIYITRTLMSRFYVNRTTSFYLTLVFIGTILPKWLIFFMKYALGKVLTLLVYKKYIYYFMIHSQPALNYTCPYIYIHITLIKFVLKLFIVFSDMNLACSIFSTTAQKWLIWRFTSLFWCSSSIGYIFCTYYDFSY